MRFEVTRKRLIHSGRTKYYELLFIQDNDTGKALLIKRFGKVMAAGQFKSTGRVSRGEAFREFMDTYEAKCSPSHHDGPYRDDIEANESGDDWSEIVFYCRKWGYQTGMVNALVSEDGTEGTHEYSSEPVAEVVSAPEIVRPSTWGMW